MLSYVVYYMRLLLSLKGSCSNFTCMFVYICPAILVVIKNDVQMKHAFLFWFIQLVRMKPLLTWEKCHFIEKFSAVIGTSTISDVSKTL